MMTVRSLEFSKFAHCVMKPVYAFESASSFKSSR